MSSHDEIPEEQLWENSRSDDEEERADSLLELGHRARVLQDWTAAKNLYGSALDLYEKLEKESEIGRTVYSLGYCLYRLGEHGDAITTLQRSLAKGRELNDSNMIAYSAGPLGDCLAAVGQTDEAIAAYDLAVDAFVEIEDEASAGFNALSLGDLHGLSGRQTRALECFIRAFNIFQTGGEAFGSARAKDRMASALIELGDNEQAIMHLKDALDIFTFLEAEERIAYTNYRVGWTLNIAGKYIQSESYLRKASQSFRAAEEWSRAAMAEYHLAMSLIYRDHEEPQPEAEALIDRIATYFDAVGEQTNVLMVESLSADRLMIAGLWDDAAALWEDILSRAIVYNVQSSIMTARVNLAECLFMCGRHLEGQKVFEEVDAGFWGENNPELENIERVKELMLATMPSTLPIDVL